METDNSPNATLMEEVYGELRRLARSFLRRERNGHTLQTSALVHEAYLRLANNGRVSELDRAGYYYSAASAMRRILVDQCAPPQLQEALRWRPGGTNRR